MRRVLQAVLIILLLCVWAGAQEPPEMARLGECRLESGEVIRNCQIAYRTFGNLNADKSNAILFPTWFTGTTANLVAMVGPGRMLDTSKYYVILVDALGNGVSSSPSNSAAQPGRQFPRVTIRDMVNSQHRLLTEVLGIQHLCAVIGMSMGGMQAFEWIIAYPDSVDKAVPIVGTPQMTSYDLLLWRTELEAIVAIQNAAGSSYLAPNAALRVAAGIHALALTTPQYRVAQTSPGAFPKFFADAQDDAARRLDANNYVRQLQAMMTHDIAARFGGSLERAAEAVRAQVLVIVARQDHMVNPEPALRFAKLLRAEAIELESDCGHLAFGCEREKVAAVITRFLEQ